MARGLAFWSKWVMIGGASLMLAGLIITLSFIQGAPQATSTKVPAVQVATVQSNGR